MKDLFAFNSINIKSKILKCNCVNKTKQLRFVYCQVTL